MSTKPRFVLIDANALVHRAFHAIPELTTTKGVPVNAVYGFLSILLRVLKELKPMYVAAAFDRQEKTFRHKAYDGYKAKRVKAPPELYAQIPIVKEILRVLNIPILEKAGFEADDMIGTLATKHADGTAVFIVSGDNDLLQLVCPTIQVYTMKRSISDVMIYDRAHVEERYGGLSPDQLTDYKALAGDASDNIPGVKGIGEKTAIQILRKHNSIEQLYRDLQNHHVDDIKPRIQTLLLEHKADAELSKRLGTIDTSVEFPFQLSDATLKDYDHQEVIKLLQEYGFRSLIPRVAELANDVGARGGQQDLFEKKTPAKKPHPTTKKYTLIAHEKDLNAFVKTLSKIRVFALDTETDRLSGLFSRCVGMSIAWNADIGFFVDYAACSTTKSWKSLVKILENPTQKKVGHNIKYDLEVLRNHQIDLQGVVFDTMIASYLLNPGARQNKLSEAALAELGYEMQPIEELIGHGNNERSMAEVPMEDVSWYACEDADLTWQLYQLLEKRLDDERMSSVMHQIEVPLISVLATVEANGALLDTTFLKTLETSVRRRIQSLERRIHKEAGKTFNVASPSQLADVLFETLELSSLHLKKTKTGISTQASELEKLKGKHPIIDLVLEYRELAKLQSTYIEALPIMVVKETGRIHTSYNQTIAATGRLSSSDPNLQNIPIRTLEGREIRKAFIAPKGHMLLSIDYSQIELRAVASIANDPKMIEVFRNNEDIHRKTAAEIHGVSIENVTPEMRYAAKEVNFGVLYGMGAYGLASRTGISREEAAEFIQRYFDAFSRVKTYIEETIALTKTLGYAETLLGRRRYIPEIRSSNVQLRRAGERMAVNMPIQGLAADLMKLAMIEVDRALPKFSLQSRMILQVHDELVFEVPEREVRKVAQKVKQLMEQVYELRVPIVAECKVGANWGDMTALTL